ncbi:unnamed protein product [Caenorhabditis sp. 36 PRJEB53466]|nr:unnamed protein product [Caenorhabditis sp. 36 PRJEB53466]
MCSRTARNVVKQCKFEVEGIVIGPSKTTLLFGKRLKETTWQFVKNVHGDGAARNVDGVYFAKVAKHADRLDFQSLSSENSESEVLLALKYFDNVFRMKDYGTEPECDMRFVIDVLLPLAPKRQESFGFHDTTKVSAADFKNVLEYYEGLEIVHVNLQTLVFHEKMIFEENSNKRCCSCPHTFAERQQTPGTAQKRA